MGSRIKLLLGSLLLLSAGCEKTPTRADAGEKQGPTNYIIFGHFYGMCMGETCVETYKLTADELFEDTLDEYPVSPKAYDREFVQLPDSLFKKVSSLLHEIPSELRTTESSVFGMPDAGDWGGMYLAWSEGDTVKYWLLDNIERSNPAYLRPFAEKMQASINELSAH